jgi:hypothetical protein
MAGELVPLVMLPRYSTFVGDSTFTTVAMDVTAYSKVILNVWRGRLGGSSPTFGVSCLESTDQETWTACAGTNVTNFDPTEEDEGQVNATVTKRWFRIEITLGGTSPMITCWAVGFLEERLS